MNADEPIRLTVLAGFLGSGKTTWLRHQLLHGVFDGARVIVNEAAAVPVDDALLAVAGARVIAGGCACCDRLEAALDMLRTMVADWPAGATRRIVFETSGLAEPAALVAAVRADPVLDRLLVVSEVLVAVDALHGAGLLRTEALARRQVAAADALILTKVDAAAAGSLEPLMATLQALNPRAQLFGAAKGVEVALPDPGDAIPEDLSGAADRAPAFATTIDLRGLADWPAVALWLAALLHARGDDVLRVKGVISGPAGRLLVQTVQRMVQVPELMPAGLGQDDRLVVIGRGFAATDLVASLRAFGRG